MDAKGQSYSALEVADAYFRAGGPWMEGEDVKASAFAHVWTFAWKIFFGFVPFLGFMKP